MAIGEARRISGSAAATGFDLRRRRRLGGTEMEGKRNAAEIHSNAGEIWDRESFEKLRGGWYVGVTGLAGGKAVGLPVRSGG